MSNVNSRAYDQRLLEDGESAAIFVDDPLERTALKRALALVLSPAWGQPRICDLKQQISRETAVSGESDHHG